MRNNLWLRADSAKGIYAEDLEALEATVRAMEAKLRDVRACIQREKEAIPKASAGLLSQLLYLFPCQLLPAEPWHDC